MKHKHKSKTIGIKEGVDAFLDYFKLKAQYNKSLVISYWPKAVGPIIANRTSELFFSGNVLYLRVSSAPLKQELIYSKDKIKELLNKELGFDIITDIQFLDQKKGY